MSNPHTSFSYVKRTDSDFHAGHPQQDRSNCMLIIYLSSGELNSCVFQTNEYAKQGFECLTQLPILTDHHDNIVAHAATQGSGTSHPFTPYACFKPCHTPISQDTIPISLHLQSRSTDQHSTEVTSIVSTVDILLNLC